MSAKLRIAVLGATGAQGGSVVKALLAGGDADVIAISRNVDSPAARALAALSPRVSLAAADINDAEQLEKAFAGATGAFLVSMFWDASVMGHEYEAAIKAVNAAKAAGVGHIVWSTLANVEEISGGKYSVPHFTDKARVDPVIAAAGFQHHTFVAAACYFQNLASNMLPRAQPDGSFVWALPLSGSARVHFGDVTDIGVLAATAFYKPETYGNGARLYVCGQLISFDELAAALSAASGKAISFYPMSVDDWNKNVTFPGASELAQMLQWFQEFGYYGPNPQAHIDAAAAIARPRDLAAFLKTDDGQKLLDKLRA